MTFDHFGNLEGYFMTSFQHKLFWHSCNKKVIKHITFIKKKIMKNIPLSLTYEIHLLVITKKKL